MIKGFKQFLLSDVCLSCLGCCRFKDEKSEWRAKVGSKEVEGCKEILKCLDERNYLKTQKDGDVNLCSFLHSEENVCAIYDSRPFECQLYPFILIKDKGEIGVYVHLSCPYVQDNLNSEVFAEYVKYLKIFFQEKDVHLFLQQNKEIVGDYLNCRDEFQMLFILEG